MDIRFAKVMEKFKLYSREELDGSEPSRDALCQALCQECIGEVRRRVKPEVMEKIRALEESSVSGEVEEEPAAGESLEAGESLAAIESLAASEAFWQITALDEAAVPAVVRTPEVTLQLGDRRENARRLRERKESDCRELLREDRFFFGLA